MQHFSYLLYLLWWKPSTAWDVLQGPRELSYLLPLSFSLCRWERSHFSWGRGEEQARLATAQISFKPPLLSSSSILAVGHQKK